MRKFLLLTTMLFLSAPAFAEVAAEKVHAFQTSEGMKNGAVFLTLKNTGDKGDALVSASSDVAGRTELHEMSEVNGIMKMRKVDKIDLGADKSVELKSGGYHIMLMDLKKPLKAGENFPLTLTFESGKKVTVQADVTARSKAAQSHGSHGDHGHH